MRLVERGAEFNDAFSGRLDWHGELESGCLIEEKDHTVEFPFTGSAGERETDGMKEFAAAEVEGVFQRGDDFFEAIGGQRSAIQQEKREMAEDVACGLAREHRVTFDSAEEFFRVVVKNEMEKIGERAAVGDVRAEECRSAFAPSQLLRRSVAGKPVLWP